MATKKIPTLGEVASAQADEKRKTKIAGALATLGELLGIGAAKPDARMTKRTETMKHVVMEEADDAEEEEEEEGEEKYGEEEEEEEEEGTEDSTGSTGSTGSSTGSTHPPAEEEEEEEKIAKAYAAADKAFAKVVSNDPGLLLRRPTALAREARKGTGQRSISGAMGALSGFRAATKAQTKVVERVARIEADQRDTKVNAMLAAARKEGKITRAEVMSLKAQGMKDPRWLKGHLAILPQKIRTTDDEPIVPREGTDGNGVSAAALGAEQLKIIETMTATMAPEAKAEFMAKFLANLEKPKTTTAARRPRS